MKHQRIDEDWFYNGSEETGIFLLKKLFLPVSSCADRRVIRIPVQAASFSELSRPPTALSAFAFFRVLTITFKR